MKNRHDSSQHSVHRRALPLLAAAAVLVSGCTALPAAAENPAEKQENSGQDPAESQQNFWHLIRSDSAAGSDAENGPAGSGERERYESAWFKLNEAGDAAEGGSPAADSASALSPALAETLTEAAGTVGAGAASHAFSAEAARRQEQLAHIAGQAADYAESADFPASQEEYEKALGAAYAAGYEDGYTDGSGLDDSRLDITYRGDGLSTESSVHFLAQGLPALRAADAAARCYAALGDFTGEKKLQLYRQGVLTDLSSPAQASTSGDPAPMADSASGDPAPTAATASGDPVSLDSLARQLQAKIKAAEKEDLHLSFLLLDIGTGTILAYNSEQPFYSASSAKAHYIVSLAGDKPEVITKWKDTIRSVTVDSSNENYHKLQDLYSLDCYRGWLSRSGVSAQFDLDTAGYAFCTAEDAVRLWLQDYLYFEENENGQTVGEWFETPNVSAIRTTVEEDTRTRTKAGWIIGQEAGYTASADAGIVYEEAHPYILAMMSDYPAAVNKLEQYASLLEQMHTLLTEEAGT